MVLPHCRTSFSRGRLTQGVPIAEAKATPQFALRQRTARICTSHRSYNDASGIPRSGLPYHVSVYLFRHVRLITCFDVIAAAHAPGGRPVSTTVHGLCPVLMRAQRRTNACVAIGMQLPDTPRSSLPASNCLPAARIPYHGQTARGGISAPTHP